MSTWRIGKRVPINVYEDDHPVCQCHTAIDAQRIVAAMNRVEQIVRECANVAKQFAEGPDREEISHVWSTADHVHNLILRKFGLKE